MNMCAYILDTCMLRLPTNDYVADLLLGDSATLLYHSEYKSESKGRDLSKLGKLKKIPTLHRIIA